MEGMAWAEGKAKDDKTIALVQRYGGTSEQFVEEALRNPREWTLQQEGFDILYDGEKVGWARISPYLERNQRSLWIEDIWIWHRRYRRKGIGTFILKLFEDIARKMQVHNINGSVHFDNRDNALSKRIRFFLKNGYTIIRYQSGGYSFCKLVTGKKLHLVYGRDNPPVEYIYP